MQIGEPTRSDLAKKYPQVSGLNLDNPNDNVMVGALELREKIESGGSTEAGLEAYVGVGNTSGYASNVMEFYNDLNAGQQLRD